MNQAYEGYPEKLPEGLQPMERFTFSTSAITSAEHEVELQLEALETRVERLCNKRGYINDIPVLSHILGLTHEPAQLKALAQGLDRVADIIEQLDELKAKQKVLELAKGNPSWFAWAFGDLESDVDSLISKLDSED